MSEEEYQKLNSYLNIIFQYLDTNDPFFLTNLKRIIFASEKYNQLMKDYDMKKDSDKVSLTTLEIYALGREVIETFCPCYLEKYDSIMESGILDFSHGEQEDGKIRYDYENSHFKWWNREDQRLMEININLEHNYADVCTLIHEFMHMTNANENSIESNILTEFISIYFEIKTMIYLIEEKGVHLSEINWNNRFLSIKRHTNSFNHYSFPFACYYLFGEVHPKYIDETNSISNLQRVPDLLNYLYPYKISKADFEKKCKNVLIHIEDMTKTYQKETGDENLINVYSYAHFVSEKLVFNSNYNALC